MLFISTYKLILSSPEIISIISNPIFYDEILDVKHWNLKKTTR